MAAFNFFGNIFTTGGHGQAHVDEVLAEHGITIDWRDPTTEITPDGGVRGNDGTLYKADTVEYDDNGEIISGQYFYDYY